ncbi:MAG: hypothetical protein VW665_09105 [Candidatus Puniceispirillum sp.]
MRPQPMNQSRLGKYILRVSICFVLIFLLALMWKWVSSPQMFQPVFG